MEEIEVPLEQSQEAIHEAHHHSDPQNKSMMTWAAVLSACLAVAAAISALFAGHYANDAMIEQIKASDQWAYYQSKGVKANIAQMQNDLKPSSGLAEKIEKYHAEQEQIKEKAQEIENESAAHLKLHQSLAASVTLFQVAIALTAIAVLTRKKPMLFISLGFGFIGLIWMIKTFLF